MTEVLCSLSFVLLAVASAVFERRWCAAVTWHVPVAGPAPAGR